MAKHPAGPTFSTIGCNIATAPPALRHRTRLLAAWAVADLFMFRSVRRVPQSWEVVSDNVDDQLKGSETYCKRSSRCGTCQELHYEHDSDVLAVVV